MEAVHNMKYYGFREKIDYGKYLPLYRAEKMLEKYNGIAFQAGKGTGYYNGKFNDISFVSGDKGVVFPENGVLYVDCDSFFRVTGINIGKGNIKVGDAAEKLCKEVFVYEDKLAVFLDRGSGVNVFDNYYTFEMISLKLRNAPAEDFDNALMELPPYVSNGINNTVVYSDPDLELGLATTLYSLQNSGKEKPSRPRLAAGEGKNDDNHTVIRVYNEYSAKTAQFSAFPASVTGGVKIACAYIDCGGTKRGVIAAAAYNAQSEDAKSVNVYDEYGVIYMQITPGIKAPYNILTGHFSETDNTELLVASEIVDECGKLSYEVYNLTNGDAVCRGSADVNASCSGAPTVISRFGGAEGGGILILADSSAYRGVFTDGKLTVSAMEIDCSDGVNGIYESAFSDGIVAAKDVSDDKAHRSFILKYDGGTGKAKTEDVGAFENVFFWNGYSDDYKLHGLEDLDIKETEYVKYAPFRHQRTDLASSAIGNLKENELDGLAEFPYSKWKTGIRYGNFGKSCNVWEPCFTHRFNKMPGTCLLAGYTDANGIHRYLAYTDENETADYLELDSAFFNATYAEGIIELDKMRIYPLRDTLGSLYGAFVKSPECLAGLEPIHEIEIAVGDSVGDYNPNMIEGFRSYLIERFGSVENINAKFGTDFSSREDIDAPRDGCAGERGDWDKYSGDYFQQWQIFTRKVVNKRLTESFREALLAGFPSEIISGHSIPEGDAISGFLEQANTRMSPVDAMMTLGCHFGATRYGTWYSGAGNFLDLSYSAGFRNVTMGEYNSMSSGKDDESINQMRYIWNHGSKYICVLNVSNSGTCADLRSIEKLSDENNPRPGYAEGTTAAYAFTGGGKRYQIVELGGNAGNPGLLKSVDSEGKWTGDIYLCPFHSHIDVSDIGFTGNNNGGFISDDIVGLQTGDVVEVSVIAARKCAGRAEMRIDVCEDGIRNERLSAVYALSDETVPYKFTLSNQVPMGKTVISVSFDGDDVEAEISGSVQRESVARKFYGNLKAREHKGGVTFDIIQ